MPMAVSRMSRDVVDGDDPLRAKSYDDARLRARVAALSEALARRKMLVVARDEEIAQRSAALTAERAARGPESHDVRLRELEQQLIEAQDDLELSRVIVSSALNRTKRVQIALALVAIARIAYLVLVGR